MKKQTLLISLSSAIILSACSQMPSECEKSWEKIEKMALKSGIPKDAIKNQKNDFIAQIKGISEEQAIETCKMQNSFLDLADQ